MEKNLVFDFNEMSVKGKLERKVSKYFKSAGVNVVQQDVATQIKRTAGVSYREMLLTFSDSQTVTFRIKQSGDIFQVLINNKVQPMKNQDDHVKAIAEIVTIMDKGRSTFQKRLANVKAKLPAGIRTAVPKLEKVLANKKEELTKLIQEKRDEAASIRAKMVVPQL